MIRLRQVALVARDLEPVVDELAGRFGLSVCFRDPGVAEFGLHNALFTIGDQFLEIVSPTRDGTTAGRLLDKRHGDGGYMVIYEVDDLDARQAHLSASGVRVVWRGDFDHLSPGIRGRHLHPRDVGGAIVSLDEPTPGGSWRWAGPAWRPHVDTSVVSAIAGVVIGAAAPEVMAARWETLGLRHAVAFAPAGPRGDGVDEVHLVASDRSQVGAEHTVCGVRFKLV